MDAHPVTDRPPLRLLLVQAHAAAREAMAAALEAEPDIAPVQQAGSCAEARAAPPVDVVVVELLLPDGGGAALVGELRRQHPGVKTLVLDVQGDRTAAATAVEHGTAAVLPAEAGLADLLGAIRRLHGGEPLMPLTEVVELLRVAAERREREHEERWALERLTPREREVLQFMADGLDAHAAAARMCVSPRTHRNHIANILAKLDVHSQLQAVLLGLRYELVRLGRADDAA